MSAKGYICSLPDNLTLLSLGGRVRQDFFDMDLYPCEMNANVGYFALEAKNGEKEGIEVKLFG